MRQTPRALPALLVQIMRGTTETSIEELLDTFQMSGGEPLLTKLLGLKLKLEEMSLIIRPDFSEGDISSPRCISMKRNTPLKETVESEIVLPESSKLEFKTSLLFDHQKAENNPSISLLECKSDNVTHSALKSVAAFLNSGGGLLYIGIRDNGEVLGLEADNNFLKCKNPGDFDGWQLLFRDLIQSRFKDGETVGHYIETSLVLVQGKYVARIQVAARAQLSFLRTKDSWRLYRRDGNRTLEVAIYQVEEFLSSRETEVTRTT